MTDVARASDREIAQAVLSDIGRTLGDTELAAFAEALDRVRIARLIVEAARLSPERLVPDLMRASRLAKELGALLYDDELARAIDAGASIDGYRATLIHVRWGARSALRRIANLTPDEPGTPEAHAAQVLHKARPADVTVKSLGKVAAQHLKIAVSVPKDTTGVAGENDFTGLVRAVYKAWGWPPPTAEGIRSALHRGGKWDSTRLTKRERA